MKPRGTRLRQATAFLLGSLSILAVTAGHAATITEFVGPFMVVSPQFYGAADSGTYYHPTTIEANGFVFLFTQGGQFQAATSPVPWCEGDKVILWRAPHTATGVTGQFLPLGRVSPCDSTATVRVHWTETSAYYSSTSATVNLIVERQAIDKATGVQLSTSVWLFRGVFTADGSSIDSWQYYKLFDTVAGSPGRIESFVISADTSRTAPPDGFSHELFRGFARKPSNVTVEFRMDISDSYCGNSSAIDICARIEFKQNGNWTSVVAGQFNFVPDSLLFTFRPNNIAVRAGQVELWGAELIPNSDCPCVTTKQAARFVWYTIDPATFSIAGPNQLLSSVRCMPAEPHTTRMGVDVVTLPGGSRQYLLTGHNDDQACVLTSNPFIGIDIVTTRIQ